MRALATLFILLTTTAGSAFASVTAEELLIADLSGRLDVAERDRVALANVSAFDLPPKEAISYFRQKKLMTAKEFGQLEDSYKARGFKVAGLHQHYTLHRVHSLLSEAIETGSTRQEFMKRMNAQWDKWGLTRLGRHHLETIFDTNVLQAYAAGRYKQMTRPGTLKARPYWQYRTTGDDRVRPTHSAMDGRVIPADSPIWDEWHPPNGYRCRCGVFSLSQADLERRGLQVETELPQAIEDGVEVHQLMPDRGFSGSPATQARADKVIAKVSKRLKKSGMLSSPQVTQVGLPGPRQSKTRPARPPVHTSAGDLLRTDDARRNAKVDAFAGLTPKEAEQLAKEQPFYNVFPGRMLAKVPKGETWVEVPLYSQNLDSAEQLLVRMSGARRTARLVERVELRGRASYGDYELAWSDPEVAHDLAAAKRLQLGDDHAFSRSTEMILRFKVKDKEELAAVLAEAMQTEKGHGAPIRRAWEIADVRIRGALLEGDSFTEAVLNRRKKGTGFQVVLSKKPFEGWDHEAVAVNHQLYDCLP